MNLEARVKRTGAQVVVPFEKLAPDCLSQSGPDSAHSVPYRDGVEKTRTNDYVHPKFVGFVYGNA